MEYPSSMAHQNVELTLSAPEHSSTLFQLTVQNSPISISLSCFRSVYFNQLSTSSNLLSTTSNATIQCNLQYIPKQVLFKFEGNNKGFRSSSLERSQKHRLKCFRLFFYNSKILIKNKFLAVFLLLPSKGSTLA
jgi:hypothetical protein